MYKINTRVLAWDKDWIIPGAITAIEDGLYKIEYDCGGYDWLLRDEVRPLEYHIGDYVKTTLGIGRITANVRFNSLQNHHYGDEY